MGLDSCQIILDNEWGVYYAGDIITGRVELVIVDSPKKVRGIRILFRGLGHTEWVIEESKTNNQDMLEHETIEYTGNEDYFKMQFYLIGGQGSELEIPVGQHTYPFTCVLPPLLPSSYEGEFGYVRYTIKVTLDRPWKFDQEAKKFFTVLCPVDLNVNSKLKERVQVTLEKYFCCCWCRSGPLMCVVTLPCTGFVPGQSIPILVELDNASNVDLQAVDVVFSKTTTYYSQFPRREVKKANVCIGDFRLGTIKPTESQTYNQFITIPPIPPSNLTRCRLIDVDYTLTLEVHVAGMHKNLFSKIPITVGTIPFTSAEASAPPETTVVNINPAEPTLNNHQALTDGAKIGWISEDQESNAVDMQPDKPTYGRSQFLTRMLRDAGDNDYTIFNDTEYAPYYPVFNLNHTSK